MTALPTPDSGPNAVPSSLSMVMAEHAPWPMSIVEGVEHVVRYVNVAFCRLMDNPTRQLVGQPFGVLLPGNEECVALLDRVYRTGKSQTYTEKAQSHAHPVLWSYTMWPILADELPVGVMIQVTETGKFHENTVALNEALTLGAVRQHQLTEAADFLNTQLQVEISTRETNTRELAERARLLDLSQDAIIVCDLNDHIHLWSKGAEKLYGWNAYDVIGQHLHTLLQTEFEQPLEDIVSDLLREGQYNGEVWQVARDGRRIPSLCRWVFDFASKSILASYTDITDRRAAELKMTEALARAVEASRAKDDFIAALSHELRTPLNPVLLMASDAARDATLPASARELFAMIEKNVKLEARLIDDLLDVTRITHGKIHLELQVIDVHVPLRDAIETVRAELETKKINLQLNLVPGECFVRGDSVRLQQIFWNVLRNAVKFSPSRSDISVTTIRLPGQKVGIKITDAGLGIKADELGRLFASFSQGDHASPTGSHRFGGLGLGLSISRSLAELHSGTIHADSLGTNQGATFTIELPLVALKKSKAAEPSPASEPAAVGARLPVEVKPRTRILLVEDHETTRNALTILLTRRRCDVTAAASLAAARHAAAQGQFDLLISDIGLPDGSGNDLMTELHAAYGLRGIALTGYGSDEDLARSQAAGFIAHLTKPVSIQSLEKALAFATSNQA